jgi:hypothetical protein
MNNIAHSIPVVIHQYLWLVDRLDTIVSVGKKGNQSGVLSGRLPYTATTCYCCYYLLLRRHQRDYDSPW